MNECLSGKSSYWGKSSAGMTYRGSYLQDRSTYMEGCHKILSLKIVYLLFWSIFSLSEGTSSSRVRCSPRYTASHIHISAAPTSTAPACSFGSPETKTQTSSYCFNPATQLGSVLAFKHCLKKASQAENMHPNTQFKDRGSWPPPGQPSAARHRNSCHVMPFQKPSHLQNPTLQKNWEMGRAMCPHNPSAACSEQAGASRHGLPALWQSHCSGRIRAELADNAPVGCSCHVKQSWADPQGGQRPSLPGLSTGFCASHASFSTVWNTLGF